MTRSPESGSSASAPGTPEVGARVELSVHELGYGGVGVARHASGLVCLVPRTLPGEVVEVQITKRKARLALARPVRIVRAAAARVPAPCAHFDACGGCHLQHLAYEDQLRAKRTVLARDVARALGEDVAGTIAAVVPAARPLGYRNQSLFHVERGQLGFVDPERGALVPIATCLVLEPAAQRILDGVRAWLAGAGARLAASVLDVAIRTGRAGVMCVLVVAQGESTDPEQDLDVLRQLAATLQPASVWLSPKPRRQKTTWGETFEHMAGAEHVVETVGPFHLQLSPSSFAQANAEVAGAMYARATQMLANAPDAEVLDLYAGSGALALHLARRAAKVVAVELNPLAVANARANAARNGVTNVEWRAGKCEDVVRGLAYGSVRLPFATLNPPRTGLHPSLPSLLARLQVERMVYVSCAPPTLIRDLGRLRELGFAITEMVPFDMFAQTHHVETLVLLERRGSSAST